MIGAAPAPAGPRAARIPALAWGLGALALCAVVLSPVVALVLAAGEGLGDAASGALWPHLLAHVLPRALRDTGLLLAGTGALVIVLGAGSAWLVAAYAFPGRRLLEAALLLPMAVPTYIVAFAYLDLMHPIGPVQTTLRDLLGYARPRDLALPDIRSLPGCILLLGFVLYPYVYLPTRALFLMQAANLIEASRMLGRSPSATFLRVALPMARPAIALGASLALMEALNDIGAAEFLGVRTLTVQVYATWINRSDLAGAAQIALVMLMAVAALVALERWARAGRGFAGTAQRPRGLARRRLAGPRGWIALALGLVPVAIGFLIPASYLAHSAARRVMRHGLPETILSEIGHTLLYAGAATGIAAALGFLVAAGPRLVARRFGLALIRVASLGYALPGAILAIGLLGPLALADSALSAGMTQVFGAAPALIGLGTGGALVTAYLLRFLAVSIGTCEAGLGRLPRSLPDAGRMLGHGPGATLRRVQLPLAWPAVLSGALLVFVDCVKELPTTLLLRPLNVETLATHLYGEAARGTYEDGSVAALLIVAVGLVPVVILLRLGTLQEPRDQRLTGPRPSP
ncbi:ABC transporter permease [Methylobacterium sp. J-068]|uniref:ABC transporter permease n=1 Tax=Methylobacterium sp. J-068 TaxID=2836649 RepID=UPI001FBBCD4C|nr:iron ABC transporter permease [Methylobacterium sp. J-068]MCJ2036956.1 iron ABC transporter permease [Methylobacterium sp. J-068]